ncbi:hypothetical protein GH714_019549 [Hevea brasiliensis]|uniref:Histone deacetylase complex subunit SAP18 n=1 Tax=Hevea brasiliensis TaxID=3981 RepID=A0A6A6MBI3_HEVBR|nr:hypothetical protein GH714_019549 [Hevea brasiliensis]
MAGVLEVQRDREDGHWAPLREVLLLQPVDREKTCPLLLRVFTKIGNHHSKEDFAVRGKEPKDEVQIYTWKDATLRELTDLVGKTYSNRNGKLDDGKALAELGFQIGDYLDVAIL